MKRNCGTSDYHLKLGVLRLRISNCVYSTQNCLPRPSFCLLCMYCVILCTCVLCTVAHRLFAIRHGRHLAKTHETSPWSNRLGCPRYLVPCCKFPFSSNPRAFHARLSRLKCSYAVLPSCRLLAAPPFHPPNGHIQHPISFNLSLTPTKTSVPAPDRLSAR